MPSGRYYRALQVFMPFRVQEVYDENGIYYGQNVISKNMMMQIGESSLMVIPSSSVSGSGKSFTGKNEITNLMLSS